MKFFIDTANLEDIKKAYKLGVLAGVTTNPSLVAKEGLNLKTVSQKFVRQFLKLNLFRQK